MLYLFIEIISDRIINECVCVKENEDKLYSLNLHL